MVLTSKVRDSSHRLVARVGGKLKEVSFRPLREGGAHSRTLLLVGEPFGALFLWANLLERLGRRS